MDAINMKDWKDILYDSMDDKTDNLFKKTTGCKNPIKTNKMKGIKRKIIAQLVKLNIKPIKTIILPTGIICEHYANGNVKVV